MASTVYEKGKRMRLLSIDETARHVGVGRDTVAEWVNRARHPLPSIQVGKSGRVRKVIASEVDAWLVDEAARVSAAR